MKSESIFNILREMHGNGNHELADRIQAAYIRSIKGFIDENHRLISALKSIDTYLMVFDYSDIDELTKAWLSMARKCATDAIKGVDQFREVTETKGGKK